MIGNDTHNILH